MRAIAMAGRSELGRRWVGVLAVGLAAALGLGAALGAFIAAHRTDRAYPDHVTRARIADLVVNPSLSTVDSDRVIRSLPHVRHIATHALMLAGFADPKRPHSTLADLQADNTGILYASDDGRFLTTDRIVVDQGHRPTGPRELFVTEQYRSKLSRAVGHRLRVGERLPIGFIWSGLDITGADPTQVVAPLGVEPLRIAGFGRLADEVLDDSLYPHEELVVSPDVARRYLCAPATVPSTSDEERVIAAVFPPRCSISYRYYSLELDDPARVTDVARTAQRRLLALNGPLRQRIGAVADEASYYPITTTRRDTDARVRHAVRPIVVALDIFGWVALLATFVVITLAAARLMRDGRDTDDILRALGAGRGTRIGVRVLPAAVGLLAGLAGALVVGFALSPIGPVGEVARVSASRSLAAPGGTVVPFVLGTLAASVVALGVCVLAATRRRAPRRPRRARAEGVRRAVRPEIADGVVAALAGGRAILLPGAAVVAVAAVVATAVFGTSLSGVTGTPQRYGWPWQVGAITGSGYGDTKTAAVRATLADRAGVRSWDWLGIESGSVAGRPVPVLIGAKAVDLPVVAGRAARRTGEAVLGRATADRLGVRIGDHVRITTGGAVTGRFRATVVGTAVLPSIGQFLSDRSGLGVGVYVIVPAATLRKDTSFTGVHLADGVEPATFLASIRSRVSTDGTPAGLRPSPTSPRSARPRS